MDEMKLKLKSKFMRKIVSKLITKFLCKKLGIEFTLDLNKVDIDYLDGDAVLKTDLEVRIKKETFMQLMDKLDDIE